MADSSVLNEVRVVPWTEAEPPSEEEAEARLHQEGYQSVRWYDVPGASYPCHRHEHDECLWILKGEISITVGGREYALRAGDRLYLPARLPHTAAVPRTRGVTYLIGERR